MQIIRRVYLYGVAFISLEVVVWGVIGLLRSILSGSQIGSSINELAGAIALIFVGVPVFLLHWLIIQRSAAQDPEERSSWLRAVFLYGTLLATLVPVVQNTLSLVNHLLLDLLGVQLFNALIGRGQTYADNLAAIIINIALAAYFFTVLRKDWQEAPQHEEYSSVRRLYRYIWLLYSLALAALGAVMLLSFILEAPETVGGLQGTLANSLALLLVGTPLWIFVHQRIEWKRTLPGERFALIRLTALFLINFISAGIALVSGTMVLYNLIRTVSGRITPANVLTELSIPLSFAVVFGVIWAYYGRILFADINSLPDAAGIEASNRAAQITVPVPGLAAGVKSGQMIPRRDSLRRIYFYVLALFGLIAAFAGLYLLVDYLITIALQSSTVSNTFNRDSLATALALLVAGLPLWVLAWRPMSLEARREGASGDFARRSPVRKAYLYLVLFAAVIGVMYGAGSLLYEVIRALLGSRSANLDTLIAQQAEIMLLFALLLVYHGNALRSDGRMAARSLQRRHALFPVLVLTFAQENGGAEVQAEDEFGAAVANAIEHQAAGIPVAIHPSSLGAPTEGLATARAVILPAELLARPPEAIRLWLQAYDGTRIIIPTQTKGWMWMVAGSPALASLARQAAQVVRRLAEGEDPTAAREAHTWMTLVYVLAALFTIEILFLLIALLISLLSNLN